MPARVNVLVCVNLSTKIHSYQKLRFFYENLHKRREFGVEFTQKFIIIEKFTEKCEFFKNAKKFTENLKITNFKEFSKTKIHKNQIL